VICADITFFENISYFSGFLGSSTTLSTLPVSLEDSPPLYQWRKKITPDPDNLHPHQSIAYIEVSELFRNGTYFCTQHLITEVFFSHLSL